MKVTVQSPHIEVTIEQAKTWLLRNGYAALPDKAIDSHGFRHIEYGEVVLVPKEGCFQEARRMSLTIDGISKMTGRHAIDILREMSEAAGDVTTDEFSELCIELVALRKQAILDRQSREASQFEFARLNRELNEAKDLSVMLANRASVLLDEIADTAIAAGMMDPGQRGAIDGPNAIQFLRHMRERYEAHDD